MFDPARLPEVDVMPSLVHNAQICRESEKSRSVQSAIEVFLFVTGGRRDVLREGRRVDPRTSADERRTAARFQREEELQWNV